MVKFVLKTSGYEYDEGKHLEMLKELGFTFKSSSLGLVKVSNPIITINSLEELKDFYIKVNNELVLSFEDYYIEKYGTEGEIRIYDYYES